MWQPSGLITPQSYCRVEEPYLTQLKMLGAYTIPRIDVQFAGTFQSIPGPVVQANVVYPSAVIAHVAGRPLSGTPPPRRSTSSRRPRSLATGSISWTSVSARFSSSDGREPRSTSTCSMRSTTTRLLTEKASFAVFRQPLSVLNPRLVKFSVNFDF
jgi:hypothetical protein